MNTREDSGSNKRRMRWIARIWSVPLIAYALLMVIGTGWSWISTGTADPYAAEDVTLFETLPPILMALSIAGLAVAWRSERAGALITLLLEAAVLSLLVLQSPLQPAETRTWIPYIMGLLVVIPGILFMLSSRKERTTAGDTAVNPT